MHVAYSAGVSERKVDREAWARELAALIDQEAGGNKSAFARAVGSNVRNIDRWLARTVNVSEESVRQLCRALGLPVGPMLVRLGYLRQEEVVASEAAAAVAEDEAAMALIQKADVPPSLRRQLLAHLEAQRAEHERQRLAEVERLIDMANRGTKRAG